MSRPWTGVVASLVVLAAGCAQPRGSNEELIQRADQAVAGLERLRPRLARSGTPDAELLADHLAAVRTGLVTLPLDQARIAPEPAAEVELPPMAIRFSGDGGWRLGVQAEVAAWRVRLRGAGDVIDDVGPAAVGLAVGLERFRTIDRQGEWSLGLELAGMVQDRTGGQRITLVGVRPVARISVAVSDELALTLRPLLEFGQASVHLGAAPGPVLDRADAYVGFGARAGIRLLLAGGELTAEVGWRRCVFQGSAGTLDYRVDCVGPEFAAGWGWRF